MSARVYISLEKPLFLFAVGLYGSKADWNVGLPQEDPCHHKRNKNDGLPHEDLSCLKWAMWMLNFY